PRSSLSATIARKPLRACLGLSINSSLRASRLLFRCTRKFLKIPISLPASSTRIFSTATKPSRPDRTSDFVSASLRGAGRRFVEHAGAEVRAGIDFRGRQADSISGQAFLFARILCSVLQTGGDPRNTQRPLYCE